MQPSKPTSTPLPRDEYGALRPASILTPEQLKQLNALRDVAVKWGKLPRPFVKSGKREFECLNLDVYDVLHFRGRVKGVVFQARTFWRDIRKGYTRAGKEYFLVLKVGRGIDVTSLDNATCAKRAKNAVALGDLVRHYQGTLVVKCKPAQTATEKGFKVLAKDDTGRLVSA